MSGHLSLPGEGKLYQALGTAARVKATGKETGGSCEVIEIDFPPALGLPPHSHTSSDEAFYVLEGELSCQVGDRTVKGRPGTFGFVPRGTAHAFENAGAGTASALIWTVPIFGVEGLLEELSQLPPGPPDMAKVLPILQKYGMVMAG